MSDEVDAAGDPAVMTFSGRQGYHIAPVIETRQQTAVVYPGRTTTPVSGRQKIKRTTDTPENDDEAAINHQPRSGRIYVDYGNNVLQISNPEVYENTRRQRQAPSSRQRINHNVDSRDLSSSPDDMNLSSEQPYADRRTPTTNDDMEYDRDSDVAVHRGSQRHAPVGRTRKIQRSDGRAKRGMSSSPDSTRRVRTPTSIDHRLMHNVESHPGSARHTPTGRTRRIHHGNNVDVNVTSISPNSMQPVSTRQVSDGHRTPASTTDWLRHQRSGQLTVDVIGQPEDSGSLLRAYRSMPDLLDDDRFTNETVPLRKSRNYSGHYEDDNVDPVGYRQLHSSNPGGGYSGGRVTATIRDTVIEPQDREQGYNRRRCFSSGEDQRDEPAGVVGRKRGFITGATVENRASHSRRSGRTSDMPLTDVEDLYDDVGWRKSAGHRPSHVARIYVGGDDNDVGWESSDDVLSVFSEPPQLGRLRTSNATLSRSAYGQPQPSITLTPAYGPSSMPPTMHVPQEAFELAHVDTQIHQLSPGVASPEATISAVDPALRGASKEGTNYHITLTLKPIITTTTSASRQGTMTSRSQLMTSSHMTSPGDPYAGLLSQPPRPVSAMAVYANDNPDWTTSLPAPTHLTTSLTPSSRATSTTVPTSRPRSRSRSATRSSDGKIGFDVEVRSISDEDQPVHQSISKRQTNVASYETGPHVNSSVEFTYSPPYGNQDQVDFQRVQQTAAAPSPPARRHRRPQHIEEQTTRSYHQQKQRLPEVQRGRFDPAKHPKV